MPRVKIFYDPLLIGDGINDDFKNEYTLPSKDNWEENYQSLIKFIHKSTVNENGNVNNNNNNNVDSNDKIDYSSLGVKIFFLERAQSKKLKNLDYMSSINRIFKNGNNNNNNYNDEKNDSKNEDSGLISYDIEVNDDIR